jgi:hypothetical protein
MLKEDSISINCYCSDCRNYANWVQSQSENKQNTNLFDDCGGSKIIQVCKSDLHIDKESLPFISLSRKEKDSGMFRFYSNCCNVPLFNTIDYLGFVGVLAVNLDENVKELGDFVPICEKEALKPPSVKLNSFSFVPKFMSKLLEYQMYSKDGPFNYTLTPQYWGSKKEE